MAAALDAPWLAVSVDLTGAAAYSPVRQRIAEHFRLAERLGAETVTLAGERVADEILDYARSRNVTKILIGKTHQPRWKRLIFGTVVDELLEQSGEIDIYAIHGTDEAKPSSQSRNPTLHIDRQPYFYSFAVIAIAAIAAALLRYLQLADTEANTVMLFLAGVAWTAFRFGRGPAILASVLAVMLFDFFFVTPFFTFAVADGRRQKARHGLPWLHS